MGPWNTYPLLVGTGDHYGDLLARDNSGGVWLSPGTGTTAGLGVIAAPMPGAAPVTAAVRRLVATFVGLAPR